MTDVQQSLMDFDDLPTTPEYQVDWDEVKRAAVAAFDLWNDSGELVWAERAWGHLADAGLTCADTELERHRTLLRFLVLPSFYRDWSAHADQEKRDDWYGYWAETLDLSAFTLGQLLGPEVDVDAYTEQERISKALDHLVPSFHEEVAAALIAGFGGNDDLFVSLWRVRHPAPDPNASEDAPYREDDYDALNCLNTDKLCGYQWITEGCSSDRWWREHSSDE